MSVQGFRDSVRPILTLQVSTTYLGLVVAGYLRTDIAFLEALGLVGTYFGSMITYHFMKSTKKDSK